MEILERIDKPSRNANWKIGVSVADKGYMCPTITLAVVDDDLYIRLIRYDRKPFYWLIRGFRKYTALQVLAAGSFGRHYETLIFKFWKKNGLRLGFTEDLLRDV